jgi:hypothetical protein
MAKAVAAMKNASYLAAPGWGGTFAKAVGASGLFGLGPNGQHLQPALAGEVQVDEAHEGHDHEPEHTFVLSFVRSNETSASGDCSPPAFGATLRVRFDFVRRALFCEVFACRNRGILRDDPRSVLRFERTSERLAEEIAKRLRIATDLVRKNLCRIRFVCHLFITSVRVHICSVADRSFVRVRICKLYVKRSRSCPRSFEHTMRSFDRMLAPSFVRSIVDDCWYHPPCRPPEGPERYSVPKSRAQRARGLIFLNQTATSGG